ncbi:MAG: polysaccharide biosynthesis tyrosine autokinase [Cyanobacteria bacterium P01_F01_bin.150]
MIDQQKIAKEPKQRSEHIEEIDIQKYLFVLKRRWLPATAVLGVTILMSLLTALTKESTYQAEGKVLFRSDRASALTGLDNNVGEVEVLTFQAEPLETQAEIVRSLPVMEETIQALDLRNDDNELVSPRDLLENINVNTLLGTEVLQISYASDDPEEAAAVVNQVIEAYQNQNIANNREEAAAARRFIEEQLPTIEVEVSRVESLLRQFKESNDIILLEEEVLNAVSALSNLNQQSTDLQAQLADVDAQLVRLSDQMDMDVDTALALSSLNQANGVQTVLTEIQTIQTQLSTERARYRANHPIIKSLERQQAELEALLSTRIQEVLGTNQTVPIGDLQLGTLRQALIANSIEDLRQLDVQRSGLVNRIAQLEQTRGTYRQRAESLPKLENLQRNLERRLAATQTTYETLLTQLQEIRVVENQTVGNVRIVSLADVPNEPIGPDRKLYLAGGGFIGILLAIAIAFTIDLLDNSVKSVKEAQELFGYTLLGVIPIFKDAARPASDVSADAAYPRLLVNQYMNSAIRNAYQMLQANFKFLQSDIELKTIVISSATTGEGKSEVAANLAASFAQVGRRVLLVDADMRHPQQHHALKVLNQVGLSHIIAGQATVEDAIQTATPNLDILTAGVVPPNPLALLDSNRMSSLFSSFAQEYDMVIFDSPPIVNYADASILGQMADCLLLVARPGLVNYTQGRAAKGLAEQANRHVLGLVVNGVNPNRDPDGSFYFFERERLETSSKDDTPAFAR